MADSHPAVAAASQLDQYAGDEDDDILVLPPKRRLPVLTQVLVTGITLALAFTGGVLVQKQHDSHLTSASASLPSFAGSGFAGLPGAAGGQSGSAGSGGGSSASNASSGPALIGTVVSVSGSDVTVKDLGGKTHVVHTSSSTAVTSPSSVASLVPGSTVNVGGSLASDGSVTATAVTVR
jgi:hypothetical protein